MNREQMIEKAARAILADEIEHGDAAEGWDDGANQEWLKRNARAALNAVMPQVTTVEQLRRLSRWSWLVAEVLGGCAWVFRWNGVDLRSIDSGERREITWLVERYGPLTVVWSPS